MVTRSHSWRRLGSFHRLERKRADVRGDEYPRSTLWPRTSVPIRRGTYCIIATQYLTVPTGKIEAHSCFLPSKHIGLPVRSRSYCCVTDQGLPQSNHIALLPTICQDEEGGHRHKLHDRYCKCRQLGMTINSIVSALGVQAPLTSTFDSRASLLDLITITGDHGPRSHQRVGGDRQLSWISSRDPIVTLKHTDIPPWKSVT